MSTTTEPKWYKWTLIHRSPDGHSFWKDEITGGESICDLSGERPHLTDDGVLWLESADWVVDDKYVHIPVLSDRESRIFWCAETIENGIDCAVALGRDLAIEGEHIHTLTISALTRMLNPSKRIVVQF